MVGSCLPCPSCSVPWEGMDCCPLKERSLSVGTNLGGASFDLDQFLCSVLQQDTREMFPCSVLVLCFWSFWRCLLPLEIFCCKVVEFMNLPYTWCMVKFLSSRDCNLLHCLSASLSLSATQNSHCRETANSYLSFPWICPPAHVLQVDLHSSAFTLDIFQE